MSYESPLKYFRDQNKEPDKYKEANPTWHDPEIFHDETSNLEDFETLESENKVEILGETSRKYKETIDLVKSAGLKEEFKNDLVEQNIINSRREMITKYLGAILNDARNYLSQVNYLQIQKMESYDDVAQYQSAISHSDGLRRTYHNKLISDLKIAMRLINVNFNADFPEEARLEEESKMTDRKDLTPEELKEKMARRDYKHFPYPVGVFIDFSKIPKDPLGERQYIAHWALNLYSDLSALESEVSK